MYCSAYLHVILYFLQGNEADYREVTIHVLFTLLLHKVALPDGRTCYESTTDPFISLRYLETYSKIRWHNTDTVFAGRLIGRGGPTPWPTRSPDLNLLDYFLWGYLKSLMFGTLVDTEMKLVARIIAACDSKHTRDICQAASESCSLMSCLQ